MVLGNKRRAGNPSRIHSIEVMASREETVQLVSHKHNLSKTYASIEKAGKSRKGEKRIS